MPRVCFGTAGWLVRCRREHRAFPLPPKAPNPGVQRNPALRSPSVAGKPPSADWPRCGQRPEPHAILLHRSRHALNADTIREMHLAFRRGGRAAINKVMKQQAAVS
jgi:hypothetical protein